MGNFIMSSPHAKLDGGRGNKMGLKIKVLIAYLACLGLLGMLGGCGGGDSETVTATATPQVSVDWPARSRGFSGLASAQSVTITIRKALVTGADLTFSHDRTASTDAYTANYSATQPVTVGPHLVELKFYADPGATGSLVGTASVAASVLAGGGLVRADGSPLGNVQTAATIAKVSLTPDQSVNAGASQQLAFTAQNSADQLVAVSTGSAFFGVATGGTKLTVSPSGVAQGLALGVATVVVTIDQVASVPTAVTVTAPTPTTRSFDAETTNLAFDSSRGLIYATVPATSPTNPKSFVAYDPATGAIVKTLAMPVEPEVIALSDDFQFAYLSQRDEGRVVRVDLQTFSVGLSFLLAADRLDPVSAMVVRPQHPHQVAVTHFIDHSDTELAIYDDGVPLPKKSTAIQQLAFDGPAKLYGGLFGRMTTFSVDDTGVTATFHNDNAPGHSYAFLSQAGGRLYLNTYDVLDGVTLNSLGTYPGRQRSSLVIPDQNGPYAYGLTWGIPRDRTLQVFRKSDFGQQTTFTIPDVGNSTSAFIQLSPTSFAFNVFAPNKITIIENVYLP